MGEQASCIDERAAVQPAVLPSWEGRDLDAPLAWRNGQSVSARQFLADVRQLAARLPESARIVNLCSDRYRFSVALAAAWSRGEVCLLPPNAMPDTLAQLSDDGETGQRAERLVLLSDEPGFASSVAPVLLVEAPWSSGNGAEPAVRFDLAPEAEAVCLMTSGSTGRPQPHAKRWHPLQLNIAAEAQRLAEALGRPDLRSLSIVASVPPQHSYGLESSVLLALLGGASFESSRPFYPADIAQALASVPRPRAFVTTPFHLKTLLLSNVELPPVDLVLSATAPLSPQLAARAEQAFGGVLVEIYGCTEAGQVASRRTTEGQGWTTLGELRLRSEALANGGGEGDGERFIVEGGHVAEPTVLADVLELDDERHFRLLGRSNDLIHVAGKRSSLAYLNFQLNRVEGVQDGCFWMPDEVVDGVVRPVAFVVAPELSSGEVITRLRPLLEAAFVPRKVVLVDALPRNDTGKLTAQALREFALAHGGGGGPR